MAHGYDPAVWSGLLIAAVSLQTLPCQAADLQEIIRRGTTVIQSDWAADLDYSYVERDEVRKDEKVTSKTYRVVMIDGSDYNLTLAIDDQPLSPEREKAELAKLKTEVERRNGESTSARRQRIEKFKKQRDENGALLLQFPTAFTFEILREEPMRGHSSYALSATPKKRTGPTSRALKVLAGMRGTLWIDRETFHTIRGDCTVLSSVPVYGMLARVLPGTHIDLDLEPVTDSVWLIHELTLDLRVSKLFLFNSAQTTRSTFSEYRMNASVLEELASKARQQ